ncbi:MAG: hypothetical protein RLZZ360_820 [Candidatus Parcubacteria bacterium]|jgi:hypothetical protein
MVQDVRSLTTDVVFDLDSDTGMAAALAVVRASSISREEKNELRDLIFAFTQDSTDTTLRSTITTKLQTLTPAHHTETTVTPMPATPPVLAVGSSNVAPLRLATKLGHSRPVPFFAIPTAVRHAGTPSASTVAAVTSSTKVDTQKPEAATPDTLSTEKSEVVPTSITSTEMVPKAIVDEKLADIAPVPVASTEFRPPYQEDHTLDTYRNRITEIKQFINQKVGNPVNLVDLDNAVGRAYMAALLEAMKAVSGGGGEVATPMAKLELVVKDVERLINSNIPAPETVTEIPKAALVEQSVASIPVNAATIPVLTMDEGVATVESRPRIIPAVPVRDAVPPVAPVDMTVARAKTVIPVTAQAPLKTPHDLPTAAEVKARSGNTDPLADPDVDLGLEQLLSEWTLFRKSGVFGSGPKGRQHPLFQKLANLPMPLILSGRFEGATAEIRQSITDYMNGWRYEQGIIYEQEETFEHFLRRVIRHIIDSQTRRRGA